MLRPASRLAALPRAAALFAAPAAAPRPAASWLWRPRASLRPGSGSSPVLAAVEARRGMKTIKPHRLPAALIPPYPYGERRCYKQSNRGLYGSARIRFGHNVSDRHATRTRRFWRPNVHVKLLQAPSLEARIKTRLTLRVLKTIRREGGLENYLLKSKPARIKEMGPGGWKLRWLLMQTDAVQRRFNQERLALGLEPKPLEDRRDVINYALDHATPGPLSVRSRATRDRLQAASLSDAFVIGHQEAYSPADPEPKELSDEAERELLQGKLDNESEVDDSRPRPRAGAE